MPDLPPIVKQVRSKVLDFPEPHFALATPDGNAHVIPQRMFEAIVRGDLKIVDVDDWEQIMRGVIADWMTTFDGTIGPGSDA